MIEDEARGHKRSVFAAIGQELLRNITTVKESTADVAQMWALLSKQIQWHYYAIGANVFLAWHIKLKKQRTKRPAKSMNRTEHRELNGKVSRKEQA